MAQTGTRIVTITIDGVATDIKAPSGGGGGGGSVVSLSNISNVGNRIVTITIDGTDYDIKAPGDSVGIADLLTSGTTIGVLTINGVPHVIKAPSGGGGGGSVVALSNVAQNGTRIVTITIDGVATDIKAPNDSVAIAIGGTDAAPTIVVSLGSGSSDNIALPVASATKAGIVSTGNQVFAGYKTFDRIYLGNSGASGAYVDWDDTNHCFVFHGDCYAVGGLACGV